MSDACSDAAEAIALLGSPSLAALTGRETWAVGSVEPPPARHPLPVKEVSTAGAGNRLWLTELTECKCR